MKTFLSVEILFEYNLSDAGNAMTDQVINTTEIATTEIANMIENMTAEYEPEGKIYKN